MLSPSKLRTLLGAKSKAPLSLPGLGLSSRTTSFDFSLLSPTRTPEDEIHVSQERLTGLPWHYLDRQNEVRKLIADAPDGSLLLIGYGGAVGGGKTQLLAQIGGEIALDNPGAELLIGRQTNDDLIATTRQRFDDAVFYNVPNRVRHDSDPAYRDVRRGPGDRWSRVWFRGLKNWMSLMSAEFVFVGIEEASEVTLQAVLGLLSRLRHKAARVRVLLACFNPWESWAVDLFQRGKVPDKLRDYMRDHPDLQVHFVRALMTDNPELPGNYEAQLRALYPDHLVRRLIEGLPGGVEHAVYPQFDPTVHLKALPKDIEWNLPAGAIGVDYGTRHPSTVVAITKDTAGRYWVREAWWEVGGNVENIARTVARMAKAYGISHGRVDPNQEALAQGLSGSEHNKALKVRYSRAIMKAGARKMRIGDVSRLLDPIYGPVQSIAALAGGRALYGPWPDAAEPGMYFDKNGDGIQRLSEELQVYRWEDDTSEEPWREGEDGVASLEYGVEEMTRPRESLPAGTKAPTFAAW